MRSKTLALMAFACHIPSSYALPDLIDIYQQALQNDPTYKQAYATYMSTREGLPQASAALLPTISASGSWSLVKMKTSRVTVTPAGNFPFSLQDEYRQRIYALTLSQPVLNFEYWRAIQQADYTARQALATYLDASQDLIIRTATAYFNVLEAKDNVRYSKANLRANGRSLDQAKQRFKVGLDAITSVYEAQAAYDSSRSGLIAAENNLINKFESLQLLTNHTYRALAPLKNNNVPLVKPQPNNIDKWTDTALNQNYALKSSNLAMLAAKKNISVKNAGHLPNITFTADYNHSDIQPGNLALTNDTNTSTGKFTLNIPIYQGGLVVSQTRQASYDYQAARASYESTYRTTIVNTRVAYNNIINGISSVIADRQAVKSGENSLESTDAQFKVGTRTMVDVVTSQKNLFQVQTQLATDQYSYILAILQLKYLAGTLSARDVQEINNWLSTNRHYGPETKLPITRHMTKPTAKKTHS